MNLEMMIVGRLLAGNDQVGLPDQYARHVGNLNALLGELGQDEERGVLNTMILKCRMTPVWQRSRQNESVTTSRKV